MHKFLFIFLAVVIIVGLALSGCTTTVTAPPVTVTAPAVTVTAPAVTVTAPAVTVTAPAVTVTAPAVTVTITPTTTPTTTSAPSTTVAPTTTPAAGTPVVITWDKAAGYMGKDVIVSVTAQVAETNSMFGTLLFLGGGFGTGLGISVLDASLLSMPLASYNGKTITVTGKVTPDPFSGSPSISVTDAKQIVLAP